MSILALAVVSAAHAAVVDEVAARGGRPAHGRVAGTVHLPVDRVLEILQDCEGFSRWFPDLHEVRTVGPGRCAGRTDLPWPLPDRTWVLQTTSTQRADHSWDLAFAYVRGSGNLIAMEGRWQVEEAAGGGTRVVYEASVDLGLPVPDVLVAWATRRVLPEVLAGLEAHGERASAPGPLGTELVAAPGRVELVDTLGGEVLHREDVVGDPSAVGFVDDAEIAWSVGDRVYTADSVSPPLGSEVVALCRVAGANVAVMADGRRVRWRTESGEVVSHHGGDCGSSTVAR